MNELLAHLVGDYIFQSHYQAVQKVQHWGPALTHAATYTLAFVPLTRSPWRLAVIGGTHAVIDHYRLARHVNWIKNQLSPQEFRPPHTSTGYSEDVPPWLATWLLILTDNILHLLINRLALRNAQTLG